MVVVVVAVTISKLLRNYALPAGQKCKQTAALSGGPDGKPTARAPHSLARSAADDAAIDAAAVVAVLDRGNSCQMADRKKQQDGKKTEKSKGASKRTIRTIKSTTSIGKRRTLRAKEERQQQQERSPSPASPASAAAAASSSSRMSNSEYGSQASPMRRPVPDSGSGSGSGGGTGGSARGSEEPVKVAVLGAAGGIGQPLALMLMLHNEYIQHLALYDLVHVRGVAADLSHIDRQCKVTAHLGPDELADAVRGAKVIVIPAGLAQKPGMSRDDLFGSNAKIMYNLARVCATVAPQAQLAIISNPVNSLVPLTCEVYYRTLTQQQQQASPQDVAADSSADAAARKSEGKQQQQQHQHQHQPATQQTSAAPSQTPFHESFRRIFGVTTLDVVRASTLAARSALLKPLPNGQMRDPSKLHIPVVGGHAGKTIIPLLSQAQPKFDRRQLVSESNKATVHALVESVQQAGIDVLNAKKGAGSATLAMAYAACRFTISLLRAACAQEQSIVECAYVRQREPGLGGLPADLDYFATPLLLGKDGYVKSLGLLAQGGGGSQDGSTTTKQQQQQQQAADSATGLLPFELQMIEDGARELRLSVAKGEDFAKERLSAEKS